MAKKDEDDRDIFDKARDAALPLVAGDGGVLAGRKLAKKAFDKGRKDLFKRSGHGDKFYVDPTDPNRQFWGIAGGITGGPAGWGVGQMYLDTVNPDRVKRRRSRK